MIFFINLDIDNSKLFLRAQDTDVNKIKKTFLQSLHT